MRSDFRSRIVKIATDFFVKNKGTIVMALKLFLGSIYEKVFIEKQVGGFDVAIDHSFFQPTTSAVAVKI